MNVGGLECATYVLKVGHTQGFFISYYSSILFVTFHIVGFDIRGWYCIEVKPDPNNQPINLLVTDYAIKGMVQFVY